jgi:hypothetical protein
MFHEQEYFAETIQKQGLLVRPLCDTAEYLVDQLYVILEFN